MKNLYQDNNKNNLEKHQKKTRTRATNNFQMKTKLLTHKQNLYPNITQERTNDIFLIYYTLIRSENEVIPHS